MPTPTGLCGLDFGTSNSTLAVPRSGGPQLVPLEGAHLAVPSAVFFGFDAEHAFLIGRAGVDAYVEGVEGRLLRSLKSILGSPLIHEKTPVHRRRLAFAEIIRLYVAELKRRAEHRLGEEIGSVVMGRPVHFLDDDDAGDRAAEATLGVIAREVGFRQVSFQFEPVAAALDYERRIARETLALVADIGGGTADFTLVRLAPERAGKAERGSDILASTGVRVGGADFDRYLSMQAFMPALGHGTLQKRGDVALPAGPYWDLSTWSEVHRLYDPGKMRQIRSIRQTAQRPDLVDRLIRIIEHRRAHSVLMAVEDAKIALSDAPAHDVGLGWIEPGLEARCTREGFDGAARRLNEKLRAAALACAAAAGAPPGRIDALYFTGGASQIPSVRQAIAGPFAHAPVVDGDRFGSVGLGLAVEAQRRYG